jgi:hypothetical protein
MTLINLLTAASTAAPYVLFVDRTQLATVDSRLSLRMQTPRKEPRVLWPTRAWESWAVFGYNSVVPGNATRLHRLYYDCIEGDGVPPGAAVASASGKIAHRRICLAESADGIAWTKPALGVFERNGSRANNIIVEDSGVSVFIDTSGSATPATRWKMVCSNSAYASPDGVSTWTKLPWTPISEDDTKPTARWSPALKAYVVFVRRDVASGSRGASRQIGRCITSNLSNWQERVAANASGCDVVFAVDGVDPPELDVYTNAWTVYPSPHDVFEAPPSRTPAPPAVHLFFPSMYHHFARPAPWNFANDGLLDIRLVIARDVGAAALTYTAATNARSPFVPLGASRCGGAAHAPSVPGGWCSATSGVEADGRTPFDTSAAYMASGYVPSPSGDELYFYSSGQPFTHGGDAAAKAWGNNTGIRRLTLRRDGFVAVEAPYIFASSPARRAVELPLLTTVPLLVPSDCAPPRTTNGRSNARTR